jgi:hypothetical protein
MRKQILFGILTISFFLACKNSDSKHDQILKNEDSILVKKDSGLTQFKIMDDIQSHMKYKVILDSLMTSITNQKKVNLITKLKEGWNDTTNAITYFADNYHFELKINNQYATFKDGNTTIRFADHSPICPPDPIFKCVHYGFNDNNSLREPKIIEISGHHFLYSDISYRCNGIGCGCFITFIYDLEKKKATFLENYRIPFDGFYLSDFDNDDDPDLLVISQTDEREMKGFDFEEFEIKLSWYYYDNGTFKPKFNNRFQRPYSYELYSFTPFYHHSYHTERLYSITEDNWTE